MGNKDGKIFTPTEIVNFMLNEVGYFVGTDVIDNSCGNGQILGEIVRQNIKEVPRERLKFELENHIHGIEIDPDVYSECIANLNRILMENGVNESINWDIKCGDALNISDYDGKMDFVVGNPPYIRRKDLTGDTSNSVFMAKGMVDIYLSFFELGFKQMKNNGKMIYIAPSSWYTSVSGDAMRKYIIANKHLASVWDFGHCQVFDNAQTYVSITMFDNANRTGVIDFREASLSNGVIREALINTAPYENFVVNGEFYFGFNSELKTLKKILCQEDETKHVTAKNGFATLCDDVFIGDFEIESKYIIPVVKNSSYAESRCVYPYTENGKLISEEEFKINCPKAYEHLSSNIDKLEKRKTNEPWYAFGRTQGLRDTYKKKFAIKQIIKENSTMEALPVPAGAGTYGGIYVIAEDGYEKYVDQIYAKDFFDFVKLLRKYKSGGYYTFSSKDFNLYASYFLKEIQASK